ncbi:MAG: dehydrogenase [Alphaproteobacteria bacterium]|nr:dehydrogenase [Alphaproteobacteria bacterium]
MSAREPFRVGFTQDCLGRDGKPVFDPVALEPLEAAPGVTFEFLDAYTPKVTPDQAARYDAMVVMKPRVDASSLSRADRRLKIVARHGVGFDNVDVEACTAADVALTNTPDGVRRPVATIILLFILALSHKLFVKDRITRANRWHERTDHMGIGLTGKTVGSIGVGSIGREAFRLLKPLDMVHIGHDPCAKPADMEEIRLKLVDKDTVFRTADFVCINTPLTAETKGLVGERELGLMKPTAFLVNTARGPIVDEKALCRALKDRRIAGAAIDVFEQEPTPADNPILGLDNVIVTPHSLCWTDECFRGIASSAVGSILDLAAGKTPRNVVNRAVLERPTFKKMLAGRAS